MEKYYVYVDDASKQVGFLEVFNTAEDFEKWAMVFHELQSFDSTSEAAKNINILAYLDKHTEEALMDRFHYLTDCVMAEGNLFAKYAQYTVIKGKRVTSYA